jgi:hypothetical protein
MNWPSHETLRGNGTQKSVPQAKGGRHNTPPPPSSLGYFDAMDEATLSAVRAAMMTAKTPGAYDKVYKVRVARPRRVAFRSRTDRTFASAPSLLEIWRARRLTPAPSALRSQDECVYSYDTPLSPTGLYVNLSTHHGVGEAHLALDHEKTGNVLYLHQRWVKTPKPADAAADADAAAAAAAAVPTKMAIGVEGGFALDEDAAKYDVAKHHSLVVMPTKTFVSLPCDDLPTVVLNAVDGVLRHAGFHDQSEVAAWSEERRESKYARTLTQEPSEGRKISPDKSSWRCVDTGAVENLWLNLGDGHIGSGRQHWDGSGGNGSALRHYEEMRAKGKEYPLVVKLGTIAPSGADVYSYAPDEVRGVTARGYPFRHKHTISNALFFYLTCGQYNDTSSTNVSLTNPPIAFHKIHPCYSTRTTWSRTRCSRSTSRTGASTS